MADRLAPRAGNAFLWQAARLGGSKIIFLARMLVLARLLAPEDFGLMAIAILGVEMLLTFSEFGMVPSLVQQPQPSVRQYHCAWTLGLTRALGVAGILYVVAPAIAALYAEPRAIPLLRVMAFRPLLEAAASIRVAELVRELQFRSLAVLHLSDAVVNAALSIALAPIAGVWALPAGILAGKGTYLVFSYILAPCAPRLAFDRVVAAPLLQFGRWVFAVAIISFVGRSIVQAVISRTLGVGALGVYSLAARLAFLPSEFTSELVGAVAFPLYVKVRGNVEQATRVFRSLTLGLAAVLLPGSVLLIALAPSLVTFVLGPRWEGSAPVIQVLVAGGLVGLMSDVLAPMFQGFGQPRRQVATEVVQSLVLIGAVWPLAGAAGLVGAAAAWVPAGLAAQGLGMLYAHQILRQPFAGLTTPLVALTGIGLAGGAVAFAAARAVPGAAAVPVALAVSVPAVLALEWALDRRFRLGLLEDLRQLFPALNRVLPASVGGLGGAA